MSNSPYSSGDGASAMVDSAAGSAEHAIRGSQRMANQTLDKLAGQVESARSRAGPALDGLAQDAAQLAQRSTDALRLRAVQLRERAVQARENTLGYIHEEPMKAVLIAAAAGATLMLVASLLTRRGSR